jgi:hypothetical protein
MRLSLVFVLVALFAVSPMFAQSVPTAEKAVPGQLVGLEVTSGYHLPTAIVLKGNVNVAGNGFAKGITVFVNDFSTVVTPEGRFAINFPLRSLYPDKKGTVVSVIAYQEKTNLVLKQNFDLSALNEVLKSELKFEELYK